jgi:transcriptional activator of comK gene
MRSANQIRIIIWVGIAVCLGLLSILGYKVNSVLSGQQSSVSSKEVKVGIITSDVVNDQSWGGLAYEGQIRIEEMFPAEVELLSEKKTDEEMHSAAIELIHQDVQIIIGHGREFSELFTALAPSYPDVHFTTIHGTSEFANQSVFTYKDFTEGYYAAGMAAGLLTESKKVAIITPFETEELTVQTFIKGIKDLDLNINLLSRAVGNRDNEAEAQRITKELIDAGVDVIFTRGNAYNRAVINEVRKAGIYAIGFIEDQSYMAKDHVITSIVNDVPQTYVKIMEQFLDEDGIQSGTNILTYKEGVYRLAPFGPMVSERVKKRIFEYIDNQGIKASEIGLR